jgi:hypothetical protein
MHVLYRSIKIVRSMTTIYSWTFNQEDWETEIGGGCLEVEENGLRKKNDLHFARSLGAAEKVPNLDNR